MKRSQLVGLGLGTTALVAFSVLPPPDGLSPAAMRAAGVTALMAAWWVTEAIPIAATALVPLALFPLLRILNAEETALNYGHNLVLILLAGLFIAKSIEVHHLHRRIALTTIRYIGTSRTRVILSFMVATAMLSMWISNMAVALLMLPIAIAVIHENQATEQPAAGTDVFALALMLAIAYAASIGGIGTPIGTPPNLIFMGVVTTMYPAAPDISFLDWMAVGVPLIVIFLPVAWMYLVYRFRISGDLPGRGAVIQEELRSLGPMTRPERRVLSVFVFTALGWVFRRDIPLGDAIALPGWASVLGVESYVHDVTVACVAALLLFILPAGTHSLGDRRGPRLLTWAQAESVPWGVVLLLGGGYAMAAGFVATGLPVWIGDNLTFMNALPIFTVVLLTVFLITFFTEINSNAATANIFLPVLAVVSVAGNAHPFLLMVPATIACSCAFMLPSGTGTNAVVFGSGKVTMAQMARAGFWLNFASIVIVTLVVYVIAIPVFGIGGGAPVWAR